jgi:hypothetical protein
VEVGEAVLALDFINSQLDLAESTVLILGEVTKGDFDNTTLKVVVGVTWWTKGLFNTEHDDRMNVHDSPKR